MKVKQLYVVIALLLVLALVATAVVTAPGPPAQAATPIYVNDSTGNDTWDGESPVWDGTHGPKKQFKPA